MYRLYLLFTDCIFMFSRNMKIHQIFLHKELKIFLADNMKVYSRNTGVYLRPRGRWVVNFKLRPLWPWERNAYPWNRRLIGLNGPSGNFGEETSVLLIPIFEPRSYRSVSLVAVDKYFYVSSKRVWSRGWSLRHTSADRFYTTWHQI